MAAAAYPCVTGTDHRILGPAAGHLRNRPVSLEMLVRSGPRNCVQSDPCAAGSREATPAAPTPMIQPRRVYIQTFSSCVEKNNTFARSITRYSGLKIPGRGREIRRILAVHSRSVAPGARGRASLLKQVSRGTRPLRSEED